MNGIIYCRVSTMEQVEGTSIESQLESCQRYALSNHIAIQHTFIERGESAKYANRPQLLELLEYCKTHKGRIEAVLVWRLDRLARNVTDHFAIKTRLTRYGARLVSVSEPIDANPEGRLLETILAGFAQFDNELRSIRSVQGTRKRIQQGLMPWQPPIGYKRVPADRLLPHVPDPECFEYLKDAWRLMGTGRYSQATLTRMLVQYGVQGKEGRLISVQTVGNMFRNRYYAGQVVDPWSGSIIQGQHQPMVSFEEFNEVQKVLSRGRVVRRQILRPELPLRGFVRCPHCGLKMSGSLSRGRSGYYPYYHCFRHLEKRMAFPAEKIHDQFRKCLNRIEPKLVQLWNDANLADRRRIAELCVPEGFVATE